jgi:hypothetical protein
LHKQLDGTVLLQFFSAIGLRNRQSLGFKQPLTVQLQAFARGNQEFHGMSALQDFCYERVTGKEMLKAVEYQEHLLLRQIVEKLHLGV